MRLFLFSISIFLLSACSTMSAAVESFQLQSPVYVSHKETPSIKIFQCYYKKTNSHCILTDPESDYVSIDNAYWNYGIHFSSTLRNYNKDNHIDACNLTSLAFDEKLRKINSDSVTIKICSNTSLFLSKVFKAQKFVNVALYNPTVNENFIEDLSIFMKSHNFNLYICLTSTTATKVNLFLKHIEKLPNLKGVRFDIPFGEASKIKTEMLKPGVEYLGIYTMNPHFFDESVNTAPLFSLMTRFPDLKFIDLQSDGGYRGNDFFTRLYFSKLKNLKKLSSFRISDNFSMKDFEGNDTFDVPLKKVLNLTSVTHWNSENLDDFKDVYSPNLTNLHLTTKSPVKIASVIGKFKKLRVLTLESGKDVTPVLKSLSNSALRQVKLDVPCSENSVGWFKLPMIRELYVRCISVKNRLFTVPENISLHNLAVAINSIYRNTIDFPAKSKFRSLLILNDIRFKRTPVLLKGFSHLTSICSLMLKKLKVDIDDLSTRFPAIKNAYFENTKATTEFFRRIIESPALETFYYLNINEDNIPQAFSCGKNIFEISIEKSALFSSNQVKSISHCPSLQKLHLSGSFLKEDLLLLLNLKNLKYLKISTPWNKKIPGTDKKELLKAFPFASFN